MPVILKPDDHQAWLDPEATQEELLALLDPLEPGLMEGYPVGLAVNRPSVDGPECVERA
ncbi:hypothetical protein ElP_42680 [Tautonia plasticadhaerens]|uniref:SOS response-associated peptidase n=2 Tax=Tautonia plasticadhaerens TaxID=2527974 RepID=A0A518H696_9BACT|nr:hypothetical protein ElP_42680 [Tautonia plasticadhaerens]